MAIDWFPGHMLTARRDAAATMGKVDVVIEVLDARVPHASCNPTFEPMRLKFNRPALKLLNKSDIANPTRTRLWLEHYNAQPNVKAISLSCKSPGDVKKVPELCRELAPLRGTLAKPLRMMILGIPNVGKSTLMNALLKRYVSKVADEPAVTKMQKRHALSPEMWLIDTPGMLWPHIAQPDALMLAANQSIGRNAYTEQEVAADLGRILLSDYPALVAGRYGAPPEACQGHDLIAWVARRRGFLLTGGVPDLERAAATLLEEFRSGALGRVTLEAPLPRHAAAGEAKLR